MFYTVPIAIHFPKCHCDLRHRLGWMWNHHTSQCVHENVSQKSLAEEEDSEYLRSTIPEQAGKVSPAQHSLVYTSRLWVQCDQLYHTPAPTPSPPWYCTSKLWAKTNASFLKLHMPIMWSQQMRKVVSSYVVVATQIRPFHFVFFQAPYIWGVSAVMQLHSLHLTTMYDVSPFPDSVVY